MGKLIIEKVTLEDLQVRKLAGEVVLIGVPDDRGVQVNHGRVGAADGPAAIRQALAKLAGPSVLYDLGDVYSAAGNRDTHADLANSVDAVIRAGALPIVIGGGHDNTFGGIAGLSKSGLKVGVINLDAHLDLRPVEQSGDVNSGTPFRRLIEEGIIAGGQLAELGVHAYANDKSLWDFARERGVKVISWEEMQGRDALTIFQQIAVDFSLEWGTLAVSLDLDSVAGVEAPGVSAPAVFGFSATQVSGFLQAAADNRCLRYLDLMELNPRFDIDHRTARLAAVLIWQVSQTITGQRGLV